MTQWHPRQWRLWLIGAAAMAVVIINCAAAVDANATIPDGVNGSGKDAIAAATINCHFH
jgi:hypothetical protein